MASNIAKTNAANAVVKNHNNTSVLGTNYENREAGGPIRRNLWAEKYENTEFPLCPDAIENYDKLKKIGQGTFGEVFKARHKITRNIVALKKVLMENEKEGFPITTLREIRYLKLLKHENIVNLIEITKTKASTQSRYKCHFYLVFEFCEHDLAGLLANPNVVFSLSHIKCVMNQILNGLFYIHCNLVLHRDLKAANILVTKTGILKLADFGLARAISSSKSSQNRYTNKVVTLWYRPPELLLGERNYGPSVDMWGTGCIMAELWTRSPILQGGSEQQQLTLISQICGSITPEVWPDVEKLELYNKIEFPKGLKRRLKDRLKPSITDHNALDLLDRMLLLDPKQRIDADNALNHDFFWENPLPESLEKMLVPHTTSMYELFTAARRGKPAQQPNAKLNVKPFFATDQNFERVF
ncbi:hypothetical protein HELRODRAFT_108190 [Helobdella robusta]|uniref:Protein kinase domain-containing protein n=1 Tax=Helobdella robusta TaxID=6412 RepID=T1EEG6_HELRO|nr:hypothetical protein HELRODRAFT_108190 [Helobdella robusta]ESN92963.1 hypothetical protein HELRODRAFT_108190 [Helobdella robusta]